MTPLFSTSSHLSHTPFPSHSHTHTPFPSLSLHRATRHLTPSSVRPSKATQHPGCTPPSIPTLPVVWTQAHCTRSLVTTAPPSLLIRLSDSTPLIAPHSMLLIFISSSHITSTPLTQPLLLLWLLPYDHHRHCQQRVHTDCWIRGWKRCFIVTEISSIP